MKKMNNYHTWSKRQTYACTTTANYLLDNNQVLYNTTWKVSINICRFFTIWHKNTFNQK